PLVRHLLIGVDLERGVIGPDRLVRRLNLPRSRCAHANPAAYRSKTPRGPRRAHAGLLYTSGIAVQWQNVPQKHSRAEVPATLPANFLAYDRSVASESD